MKKSLLYLLAIVSAFTFSSCGSSHKDTVEQANEMNDDKDSSGSTMAIDENDAQFLVEAADAGMMEVDLGQHAASTSKNPRIAEFGKMMETDHTKANAEVMSLASMKNVTMPTNMSDEHIKHGNDLKAKTGNDFDKDYISMMVDDHEKVISKFEKMSTDAKDPDIRALATKTLPTLRMHLENAKSIKESLK
jgi:putative membrane protein